MDDLTSMITQFLGNEENVRQLQSIVSSLGIGAEGGLDSTSQPASSPQAENASQQGSSPSSSQGPDLSALASLLGGGSDQEVKAPAQDAPGLDLGSIMMLQKAFSTFNQRDRNVELLRALKPHFSAARAKKVDDAIRILQLIKLLPLIKESGLLGSLGGD